MYDKCIRGNPYCRGCEFSPVDNRASNNGIPAGYNAVLDSRDPGEDAWYVFCHEDWQPLEEIAPRLSSLESGSLWGVIGAATHVRFGIYHQWKVLGAIEECAKDGSLRHSLGRAVPQGTCVETFDCQCLIVHSSDVQRHRLRFDEHLTFDLYVEEFCMAARRLAIDSRIAPISACHWSGGRVQPRYYEQERYVGKKYPEMCLTGTSSWVLGGNPSWGRRLTVFVKRLLRRLRVDPMVCL